MSYFISLTCVLLHLEPCLVYLEPSLTVVCWLVQRPVARGGGYGGFSRGGGGGGFRGGGTGFAFAGVCCIVIRQCCLVMTRQSICMRPVGPEDQHAWRTVGAELEQHQEYARNGSILCILCISSSFKCCSSILQI